MQDVKSRTRVLGALAAMVNMFGGFAATVEALYGEPVRATLLPAWPRRRPA